MMNIDQELPLMITGATGYVAGWIIKKLLDEGLTVCLNTELSLAGRSIACLINGSIINYSY